MLLIRSLTGLFRETYQKGADAEIRFSAAGLAYYLLFSIAPLLIIIISFAGVFADAEIVTEVILTIVEDTLGLEIGAIVENLIVSVDAGSAGWLAASISFVIILWGGSRFVIFLERTFDILHFGRAPEKSGFKTSVSMRIKSILNLITIAFFVFISFLAAIFMPIILNFVSALLHLSEPSIFLLQSIAVLLITAFSFMALYKILGNKKLSWRSSFAGGMTSSVLFVFLNALFGIYVSVFASINLYSAAGSVLALLLWLYWSSQVILYGAILAGIVEDRGPDML